MTTETDAAPPDIPPLICVVDDEQMVLEMTCNVLRARDYEVRGYLGAEEFLEQLDEARLACVVTDLRMPNVDGGELLRRLRQRVSLVSVIVLTAHADVKTAVRLMEEGATTLLEKPFQPDSLYAAVDRAVRATLGRRITEEKLARARRNLATLTPDELDVMECMIVGMPNKLIALKLHLSMRTVDRRRRSVLTKMECETVSELAALIARLR